MLKWLQFLPGFKTIIVNALVLITSVFAMDQVQTVISAETLVQIQAVLNIMLRFVTTSPIFGGGSK